MAWQSAIPKIGNKDTAPDERWDKLYELTLNIFESKGMNLPEELLGSTKKTIVGTVTALLDNPLKNQSSISQIDSAYSCELLVKNLRPGRTTTLLVDREELNDLLVKYNGSKLGPFGNIVLNYVDEQGRNPSFRLFATDDYLSILKIIDKYRSDSVYYYLMKNILEKIELAAFCKGGDRLARWKLDKVHSEYGEKEGCHQVAAKLLYYVLIILEKELQDKNLLAEHRGRINAVKKAVTSILPKAELNFLGKFPGELCPMCLERIKIIDFFRNGRADTFSMVFGHYEYRGDKTKNVHVSKNAFWLHRTCNYIQGEYTIKDRIKSLENIVLKQNYYKIKWDDRG